MAAKPNGRNPLSETILDLLIHEREAYSAGFLCVAGIDEAGRGPLAGPVVAACVVLRRDDPIDGVRDSKVLTAERREVLYDAILERAAAVGVGIVDSETIDRVNILQATFLAMRASFSELSARILPDLVLVDGNAYPRIPGVTERCIIGGDGLSASIAAASIVAKVTRDRHMVEFAKTYPHYGFERHKGYSCPEHFRAIDAHGPCPIHRRSFSPFCQMTLEFSE